MKRQKSTCSQNIKFHFGAQNWLRRHTVCFGFVCSCARVPSLIQMALTALPDKGSLCIPAAWRALWQCQSTTSRAFPDGSHLWGRSPANFMAHKGVLCNAAPIFACRVRLHCVSIQSEKKNLKAQDLPNPSSLSKDFVWSFALNFCSFLQQEQQLLYCLFQKIINTDFSFAISTIIMWLMFSNITKAHFTAQYMYFSYWQNWYRERF